MIKIFYRTFIIIILIFFLLISYLSIIGIKTNKFNSQIISYVKNIEPNLELRINDVSAKLNLFTFTVDIKTFGTDLINKNKIIKLENIKSQIYLKSLLGNKFALSGISISTKSILIKDLIGFVRLLNNDTKLLIVDQLIDDGYIICDVKIEFDEFGKIKKNYEIKGLVNDAKIALLKKKINKLNFIFQVKDKEFSFNDIKLLLNNKRISIPELKSIKQKNEFLVSGKLNSDNLKFNKKDIKKFTDNEFLNLNIKEVIFSSDSDFTFKIDKNFKLKNFEIKSILELDKLKLNNFLKLKNFFPNVKNDLTLNDQVIKLTYSRGKLEIIGSGKILLQDELDDIKFNFINDKKELIFELNYNIFKNPFVIDFLHFEKKAKTRLNLTFKGKSKKNELFFDEIILSENKNIISIQDLRLSNNYKINDVRNIKIDYLDNENVNNKLQIKRNNKKYKVIGQSLNINKIVTELLDSNTKNKLNVLNKSFNLLLEIERIHLDKNNIAYNLQGFVLLNNNKITELNLVSDFTNNKKIKLTIKNDDNETITTLFSSKARPLVDRYKFIKGFDNGELDFYSIKKNNETKSTLKIYDFKLKELPALTKLLTLASLQGIADLLSGEGIRFDEFEMNFTNKNNLMVIDEIYAIGPAISVLMEGYIEKKDLISLRGTLVPATTINKTISSIPVLGSILVGKKVGEGVFGVSFKIKGPPKNLETTVNPIKTLTPRFITRTLEKIKKSN